MPRLRHSAGLLLCALALAMGDVGCGMMSRDETSPPDYETGPTEPNEITGIEPDGEEITDRCIDDFCPETGPCDGCEWGDVVEVDGDVDMPDGGREVIDDVETDDSFVVPPYVAPWSSQQCLLYAESPSGAKAWLRLSIQEALL